MPKTGNAQSLAQDVRSVEQVNETLLVLSSQILPAGVSLRYVPLADLREQDLNAQSMPQQMFEQLVENVTSAGMLESIPLCADTGEAIEIVSGHHRTRAARAAGLTHTLALVYENLDRSHLHAKQLAHNTIVGKSDPEVVRRIWERILDVQARFEAFVDPRVLNAAPDPVSFRPVDVDMQLVSKKVVILFLPTQKKTFDEILDFIGPLDDVDTVYLAHRETFDLWREVVQRIREDLDVRSVPSAIVEMARLAQQSIAALADQKRLEGQTEQDHGRAD